MVLRGDNLVRTKTWRVNRRGIPRFCPIVGSYYNKCPPGIVGGAVVLVVRVGVVVADELLVLLPLSCCVQVSCCCCQIVILTSDLSSVPSGFCRSLSSISCFLFLFLFFLVVRTLRRYRRNSTASCGKFPSPGFLTMVGEG